MNKRKRIFLFLFSIVFLILISTFIINVYIVNNTKNQIIELSEIDNEQEFDAILVLGCKAYDFGPSLMLSKRLDKAYDVYKKINTKLLLTGDHGKNDYNEVNVMRDYLLDFNVREEDIFLDHAGFSTYDSIYRAKYIFGVKKMIIITQEYHMYRALYLANKLEIKAVGIVAEDIPQKTIMLKNEIREIFSRNKNFFLGLLKPRSKYLGETIFLNQDGSITNE